MPKVEDVEKIISLTKEIKKLEAEKKTLTDSLKDEMLTTGQSVIDYNGSKIQLVKTTRISIKKGMKDKLLLFLKQRNLKSCITITPEINKDVLATEINVGNITQEEIDQYMNYADVNSIRVTV